MAAQADAAPVTSTTPLSERLRSELGGLDIAKVAFSLAVAAVVAVQSILVYLGFTKAAVEVDEALFVDVVRSLGSGDGYRMSGQYITGAQDAFAPVISTGPTLLLPAALVNALGVEPVLAGRIAALGFYLALLAAMWLIGRRIGGRWGGLAAILGPVMLNTFTFDQSPLSAPQAVMGEYTAAALVAWALVVARRRPGVAGVLIGFAILAKVVAVFLVPAVLIAIILARLTATRRTSLRALIRFSAGAAIPIIVFEVVKLAVVGWSAYVQLVRASWDLTHLPRLVEFMVDEKTSSLWRSWFMPTPAAMLLAALALALVTGVVAMRLHVWSAARLSWRTIASDERLVMGFSGLTAGVGILVGWAALKNTDPQWLRHPAPGLVIAAGVVAAILVALGTALVRWGGPGRRVGVAVLVITALVLSVTAMRHVDASLQAGRFGYLHDQEELAAIITESGTQEVQGVWGPLVPLSVIADVRAHSILYDANPDDLLVLDVYPRGQLAELGNELADVVCGDVIYRGDVIMCWPDADIAAMVTGIAPETDAATQMEPGTQTQG